MNAALEAKTANLVAEAEEVLVSALFATGILGWGVFARSIFGNFATGFKLVKSEFIVVYIYFGFLLCALWIQLKSLVLLTLVKYPSY